MKSLTLHFIIVIFTVITSPIFSWAEDNKDLYEAYEILDACHKNIEACKIQCAKKVNGTLKIDCSDKVTTQAETEADSVTNTQDTPKAIALNDDPSWIERIRLWLKKELPNLARDGAVGAALGNQR